MPSQSSAGSVAHHFPLALCSVLFEEKDDEHFTGLCLNGIAQAVRLTCLLNMVMLRNTFVSSLARFTMLHSPAAMKLKSAWAFRWAGVWGLLLNSSSARSSAPFRLHDLGAL